MVTIHVSRELQFAENGLGESCNNNNGLGCPKSRYEYSIMMVCNSKIYRIEVPQSLNSLWQEVHPPQHLHAAPPGEGG